MYRSQISDRASLSRRLLGSDAGTASIEYGLLAALIAIASIQSLDVLGNTIGGTFQSTSATLSAAGLGGSSGGSSGGANEPSSPASDEPASPASAPTE